MSCVSKHQTPLWLPELYDIVVPVAWTAWDLLLTGMSCEAACCDTQGPLGLVLAHWFGGELRPRISQRWCLPTGCQALGSSYRAQGYQSWCQPTSRSCDLKEPREDLPDDLEFLRKAGGNCSSPVGHRNCQQSFWGACSTTWPLGLASKILESSL